MRRSALVFAVNASNSPGGEVLRPGSPWRAGTAVAFAVLTLTTFYVWTYRDCLGGFFHFDDYWVLAAASRIHIRRPSDLAQFFEPVNGFLLYRPVSTLLYFYILRLLFEYDPTGYHATQIAFHIANAALVYAIADSLFFSRSLALASALAYATAPGHAIAACWLALFTITGTAFFYFLALWVWMRLDSRWRVTLTFILFGIALLASEHAVSFPLVLALAAVLLQPHGRNWRRIVLEQAPFHIIAGAYVAAKLYYVRYGLDRAFPQSGAVEYLQAGYRMSLDPLLMLDHLGTYVGFSVNVIYGLVKWHSLTLLAGALVVVAAVIATVAVLTGRWTARPLRVATFGLDMFVVALGQVLVLPAHVFSYYVGIAALGMALALVGFCHSLPRLSSIAPWVLVAVLLVVHVRFTATSVRDSEEFRFFHGFSQTAVRWLYTLSVYADNPLVREVVVPIGDVTHAVFNVGLAHRLFLCAPYPVRTVENIDQIPSLPGRLIVRAPELLPSHHQRSWAWLRRSCPR